MRFISLFSGFGGLDLGLERAGMQCVLQVEINPYALKVLKKNFPHVPKHGDIQTLETLPEADLIAGGFPCTDISIAGKGAGLDGKHSGLWREYIRIIHLVRPRYILVENVANLIHNGLPRVLRDLAQIGYDAEWEVLPASAFGAPHKRARIFIIAYPHSERWERVLRSVPSIGSYPYLNREADALDTSGGLIPLLEQRLGEPSVFGTSDGVPYRVERLTGVGNAVVPQIGEWVGREIMKHAGVLV